MLRPTLLLPVIVWSLASSPALAQTLTNARITAHFGKRGLVALDARSSSQGGAAKAVAGPTRIPFPTEDFGVTLGGQAYESRTLPAPAVTASKDKVSFAWTAGPFQVTVVYELQPGWDFLSKQLSVASTAATSFRVDEVTVFKSELAVPITGSYIPKSARPNLGTGDYGACLRLDGRRGLLAVVQNPFLELQAPGRQAFSLRYKPDIEWKPADGPFVADRGMLAPYTPDGPRAARPDAARVEAWARTDAEPGHGRSGGGGVHRHGASVPAGEARRDRST